MRQEVHADDEIRDVSYHESPSEIPAEAQVDAERQPSIGVDGSAVSCTQVVVDSFPTSRDEPAGVHTQVGACVDQEFPFSPSVCYEEAACGSGADICRR
jgi:hypothetical protein